MAGETYTYPFDPAGTRSENFIKKERHIINPPDYMDYYFVVPFVGPFFRKDLKIVHYPSGRELVEGVDFLLSYKFVSASRATAKPVYGAISFYDRQISGSIEIDYRTLGGPWVIDESKAAEMLSNVMNNPRITTWEEVVELPESFPVIDHEWDLDDLVGASEIVEELERICAAILSGPTDGGVSEGHASNRNNPHNVTKEQVDLGNVPNNSMATLAQAQAGESNLAFMSPLRTKQLIDEIVMGSLNDHIDNRENPHGVTKAQVELGSVENLPLASTAEAKAASSNNVYMTPIRTKELIDEIVMGLIAEHISDNTNPHKVTKAQVDLGNVDNFSTATEAQSRDGVADNLFVTPKGVLAAIYEHVGEGIGDHVNSQENPHGVNKQQINLGNVPNFPMADEPTALAGDSVEHFVSPYAVAAMIADRVGNTLTNHVNDTDNPHSVTAEQLDLGNVDNFATADEAAARESSADNLFMTPLKVSHQIDELVGQTLADHVSNTENPHNVTKAQVDLGNVDNYSRADYDARYANQSGTYEGLRAQSTTKDDVGLGSVENLPLASTDDAKDGSSNSLYMTPLRVNEAIEHIAITALDEHVSDNTNPHNVTKEQVDLGNVANYAIASAEQAIAASTQHYATPATVQLILQEVVFPITNQLRADLEAWAETMVASYEDATRRIDGEEVFRIMATEDYGSLVVVGDANYFATDDGKVAKYDSGWSTITESLVDDVLDIAVLSSGQILTVQETGVINNITEVDGVVAELTNPRSPGTDEITPLPVSIFATDVDDVIVTFDDNQTWMTSDVGQNWTVVSDGAEFVEVTQATTIDGLLHLATDRGLYTYDGTTLTLDESFSELELSDSYIDGFIGGINDQVRLICPSSKTFIYFKDGQWSRYDEELQLRSVSVHDDVWVGISTDGKLFRSYNESDTWHQYRPDGEEFVFDTVLSRKANIETMFIASDGLVYTTINT